MSSPPKSFAFSKEDFPEQAGWIDRLLRPLNGFIGSTAAALNRGLTLDENIQGQIQELIITTVDPVTDSFPAYFSVKSANKPRIVILGAAEAMDDAQHIFSSPPVCTWGFASDGQVRISHVTGLSPGIRYKLRFLCLA